MINIWKIFYEWPQCWLCDNYIKNSRLVGIVHELFSEKADIWLIKESIFHAEKNRFFSGYSKILQYMNNIQWIYSGNLLDIFNGLSMNLTIKLKPKIFHGYYGNNIDKSQISINNICYLDRKKGYDIFCIISPQKL